MNANVIALTVQTASEFSSPSMAHPWIGLLFAVALGLSLRLSAFVRDLDFERALMACVVKALHEADIAHKEAAILMAYTPGQWSEIVSGLRPAPSLSRMAFLPKAFWKAFIWDFSSLVIQHKVRELADERKAG
jgi:hypothetical protein